MGKNKTTKAQVRHQVSLQNAKAAVKPAEVLSEGELRIVSLAAFLADVTSNNTCTPFIFDDPISSLDHFFEQATADRLVSLSKSRQVIVFTHRLSFSCMIKDALDKYDLEPAIVSLERQDWGAGDPCGLPLFGHNTKKAINKLITERLPSARHTCQLQGYGSTDYAIQARALCSDIRIVIERLVETDLLAEVVLRFRRGVQTHNRIERLAHIKREDCTFLDDMMTRYSRYEHSQPTEAPISLLKPDDLAKDLDALLSWQTEFSQRPKAKPQSSTVPPDAIQHPKLPPRSTKLLPPHARPT
jgi:hypothetical protein